jgi:hypothetical protein
MPSTRFSRFVRVGLEQLLDLPVRLDGNHFRAGKARERFLSACAPQGIGIDGILHVNFLKIHLHKE